jgi:hypothetical protein
MSEKPDPDDFEDEDDAADGDSAQLDHLMKDLDAHKRRGGHRGGEPAWRRLEKYLEGKRTAELLSDVDDYDIFDDAAGAAPPRPTVRPRRPRR